MRGYIYQEAGSNTLQESRREQTWVTTCVQARAGDLRIVYEVLWDRRTILIHYVDPREKAYQNTQ
jgi:mRNA-degrading endonuclease RelE of RelBE toxin-antitoxin system